jgi:hypothetical protein
VGEVGERVGVAVVGDEVGIVGELVGVVGDEVGVVGEDVGVVGEDVGVFVGDDVGSNTYRQKRGLASLQNEFAEFIH